jgi:hypothetical protein
MSHTETHVGKLRKVETGPNIEHWCQTYCHAEGIHQLSSYNDNWTEQFRDHFYKKFLVTGDAIYEKFDHTELDESDVFHMQENPDGTYTFVMQFYNGGTCLDECLEEALEKIVKKID